MARQTRIWIYDKDGKAIEATDEQYKAEYAKTEVPQQVKEWTREQLEFEYMMRLRQIDQLKFEKKHLEKLLDQIK